jgi:hypothetical protein
MIVDENLIQLEQEAKQWATFDVMKLRMQIMKLSHKGKGDLARALRFRIRKDALGVLERVSFSFPRHGVFFQKGVGRGYVMEGGKVVRGRKPSKQESLYAKAKNRDLYRVVTTGDIKRHPADWFNGTLDPTIPKLADIVSKYLADATVNATRMKIN